jgi:hypothetical protein
MRTQPGVLVRVSFVEAHGAQICRARAPHSWSDAASAKTCCGREFGWPALRLYPNGSKACGFWPGKAGEAAEQQHFK